MFRVELFNSNMDACVPCPRPVVLLALLLASFASLLCNGATLDQHPPPCAAIHGNWAATGCELELYGHEDGSFGIARAHLACQGDEAASITVAINTKHLPLDMAANFKGVTLQHDLDCIKSGELRESPIQAAVYFCNSYNVTLSRMSIQNVQLEYEKSDYEQVLVAFGGNVSASLHDVVLVNNSASGLIMAMDSAQLMIHSASMSGNVGHFGTCVSAADTSTVTVFNSTFDSNIATGDYLGGVLFANNHAHVCLANCTFFNNTAAIGNGGAISVWGDAALTVHRTTFQSNTAALNGGGLFAQERTSVNISNSMFGSNSAGEANGFGGGLFAQDSARMYVSNITMLLNTAALFGGGISAINSAELNVTTSYFEQNSAGVGGCVCCDDTTVCQLDAVTMLNCTATDDIGGTIGAQGHAHMNITHASIYGSSAASGGGAVAVQVGAVVHAVLSNFTNNTAPAAAGGAFCVRNEGQLVLNKCMLSDNSADVGGAVVVYDSASVSFVETLLVNNSARMGGALSADGDSSVTIDRSRITHNNALAFGGGVRLSTPNFDIDSMYTATSDNLAVADQDVSVPVTDLRNIGPAYIGSFLSQPGAGSVLSVSLNATGIYNIPCEKIIVEARLNSTTPLGAAASNAQGIVHLSLLIQHPPGVYDISFAVISSEPETVQPASLVLEVRGCVQGEVAVSVDACQSCETGTFSFSPANQTCDACPVGGQCSGGASVVPLPGWWQSSPHSIQMHRCLNPKACEGNRSAMAACANSTSCAATHPETYASLACSEAYTSNLCAACQTGYGFTQPFTCSKCLPRSAIIALYVVAALVSLALIKLLRHLTIVDAHQQQPLTGRLEGLRAATPMRVSDLMKPLILYLQWATIVSSLHVPWPDFLSYPTRALSWLWAGTAPHTVALECLLPKNSNAAIPSSMQIVLLYLGMPLAMLVALLLIDIVTILLRRLFRRPRLLSRLSAAANVSAAERFAASVIVTAYYFYTFTVRTVLSLFACIPLDQPASPPYAAHAVGLFFKLDTDQACFAGYHKAWSLALGVPLLIVVVAGIPLCICILIQANRHRLHDPAFLEHYGFLTRSFKPHCCAWEAVAAVQTVLLVAVSVYGYMIGPFYEALLMHVLLIIIGGMLLLYKPHLHHQAGAVAVQGVACLLFTTCIALTFMPANVGVFGMPDGSTGNKSYVHYTYGIGAAVLLVNGAFVLSVILMMLRTVDWSSVHKGFEKVFNRLSSKVASHAGLATCISFISEQAAALTNMSYPEVREKLRLRPSS